MLNLTPNFESFSLNVLIVIWVFGRQLTAGKLLDLGVTDGSKLTLVPVIEAGLVVSKPHPTLEEKTFDHTLQHCKCCFF